VFISSDEDEFSDLRGELKEILESVRVVNSKRIEQIVEPRTEKPDYYQQLIVPEIVEYARGGDIEKKMNIAMNKSHLYVGIFGKEYSERTAQEFSEAQNRGMNALVYYFTDPPTPLKDQAIPKKQTKVHQFLMELVKPKILIRGNYSRVEIKTRQELEDEIVVDILAELTVMIHQYHGVQKAVSGFEI